MDLSFSSLMAGLTFGSMGFYFIKRGKQRAEPRVAVLGLVLLVFPYFLENIYLVWGTGIGLIVLGFKL